MQDHWPPSHRRFPPDVHAAMYARLRRCSDWFTCLPEIIPCRIADRCASARSNRDFSASSSSRCRAKLASRGRLEATCFWHARDFSRHADGSPLIADYAQAVNPRRRISFLNSCNIELEIVDKPGAAQSSRDQGHRFFSFGSIGRDNHCDEFPRNPRQTPSFPDAAWPPLRSRGSACPSQPVPS